jgi:acyl-CoA synthetase (AMP-forming)/AMP-acid ligase II
MPCGACTSGAPPLAEGSRGPGSETLVDLLRDRAHVSPERLAYGCWEEGEGQTASITYAALDAEASAIAVVLADRIAPGGRVVLVYPPGLDFIAAFFGALYAGLSCVPVYPPAPPRLEAGVAHLRRVCEDAAAEAILTTEELASLAAALPGLTSAELPLPWVVTDRRPAHVDPRGWRDPRCGADDLAMIQYTSGSTAVPKGVVLRHRHLLANQDAIDRSFRLGADAVVVSWLPPYHDMGLIGCIIHPLFRGVPCYLIPPMQFLERPLRWLRAIQDLRATCSGGPNFAYDLCTRRVTEEERSTLDLSSWAVAFCGAEPIRPETARGFVQAFAASGFAPGAFFPCYGLAEASLLVTASQPARGMRTLSVDRAQLEGGRAVHASRNERAVDIASSGGPPDGIELAIVDPASGVEVAAGAVGEVWVGGASVADGYWRRPEETASTFGARLAGREGVFLRTGDLAFLDEGDLFVTGRITDQIIVRGRNVSPSDVEVTAQQADARLRPGCGAAFPLDGRGSEGVALVQETTATDVDELDRLVRSMRSAVLAELQVRLDAVVLVPPRTVPKTSSGKVQRRACRQAYLQDALPALRRSELAVGAP